LEITIGIRKMSKSSIEQAQAAAAILPQRNGFT
jgi:hypothetical protein